MVTKVLEPLKFYCSMEIPLYIHVVLHCHDGENLKIAIDLEELL